MQRCWAQLLSRGSPLALAPAGKQDLQQQQEEGTKQMQLGGGANHTRTRVWVLVALLHCSLLAAGQQCGLSICYVSCSRGFKATAGSAVAADATCSALHQQQKPVSRTARRRRQQGQQPRGAGFLWVDPLSCSTCATALANGVAGGGCLYFNHNQPGRFRQHCEHVSGRCEAVSENRHGVNSEPGK